jgi:hypothetical protein
LTDGKHEMSPSGKRLIANHRRARVLVADRVITFAEPVGQESIIWHRLRARRPRPSADRRAKLCTLRDVAAIASKKLWS